MTNNKPVLLLDVDGVINACPYRKPGSEYPADFPTTWPEDSWHFDWVPANGMTWPIHWNQNVVDNLTHLYAIDDVDIRWHTTWREEAVNISRHTGLPEFPIQTVPYMERQVYGEVNTGKYMSWWKMEAATEVLVTEHRPLIWIDDELGNHNRIDFWSIVRELGCTDGQALLLQPSTDVGLRREHFDAIYEFIETIRPEEALSGP